MIKTFYVLLSVLILMILFIGSHYTRFNYDSSSESIRQITLLTSMAPLSLSVTYDESRYNATYPEMQGLGRMDFIYEQ